MQQTTQHIMMVRPVSFGYNLQTAESNAFQKKMPTDQEALTKVQRNNFV